MNKVTATDHVQRINRVLNHIQEQLDQPLKLKNIAEFACFSTFHFHRIFMAYMGETLHEYIRRIRLEKAAHKLLYSFEPIGEVGFSVGYETPSAFAKAFKNHFAVSPKIFRKNASPLDLDTKRLLVIDNFTLREDYMQPEIVQREETRVIYVRRHGAYDSAAEQAWRELCAFAVPRRLLSENTESIGISYDDPATTEKSKLRYDACISITEKVNVEGEVGRQSIAGGKYAVFHHKGPYDMLEGVYKEIYSQWLPQSGCSLADFPCFEKYLNSPEEVPPQELKTEIHIPII